MKKTLVNYYLLGTLIFSVCVTVGITAIYIKMQRDIFHQNSEHIYTTVLSNYQQELKHRVEMIEQQVNYKKETSEARLKASIAKRVQEAYDMAESIYAHNHDKLDDAALKKLIVETLRTIRFNEGRGYYFIDTLEGDCVLYPIRSGEEGKNILHYKDIHGKDVIKDFVRIAKEEKEGFSVYFTNKPGKGKAYFQKIAFLKLLERFNWVIGAGEYLEDVEDDIKHEIATEVSAYLNHDTENDIHILEVENYEGGNDFASVVVSTSEKGSFYGQKVSTEVQDEDGIFYRKEALKQINEKGEGFVTYKSKNFTTHASSLKMHYFKKLRHWDWVVVAGKELNRLELNAKETKASLEKTVNENIRYAVLLLSGILSVLLLIAWVISRKIKHDVGIMSHFLKLASNEKIEIDAKQFKIEEFRELSVYINTMTKELKEHHDRLSLMNENLEFKVYEKTKELQNLNLSLELKNKELEHNYFTDTLTKLPNRNMLLKDLSLASFPQVILVDIDGFKNINDFYGTMVGDIVLVEFAQFILSFIKPYPMRVYRLSSDEFLIVYDHMFDKEFLQTFLHTILANLATKHFNTNEADAQFQIGMTCGVAFGRGNILEKADIALNFAKKKKLSYAIYEEENPLMNTHANNLYWRQKVQDAINQHAIVPYFQKIIHTTNADVHKFECLMRLKEGEKVISPYLFLDVAKETKLYPELSRMMMLESIKTFADNAYDFSINISLLDIENHSTRQYLSDLIVQYGVGHRLILELLESEEIMASEKFLPFVDEMKALGVRFALDDFGSGYSNFAFVFKVAPSFVKIDGSLVKNITTDKNALHTIQAIVAFAKEMNAEVIAEFVENQEIVEALEACGVYLMQGYYFSMPSPNL